MNHSVIDCPVIDDSNIGELCPTGPKAPGRGRMPRDWDANPYGSFEFAAPVDAPPIPESEWKERILDREKQGLLISQAALAVGVKTKNQQQTNFCWVNAPVQAMQVCRAIAGDGYTSLSPASGACLITNYRNVGGWATDAIRFMGSTGLCTSATWADTLISKSLDTPNSREERARNRLNEWVDLPRRNDAYVMTQLLLGRPVCVGLDFWGHEVLAMDPILFADRKYGTLYGYRFWNSWGDQYGNKGFGILPFVPGKGSPDDSIAPLVASATGHNSKAKSQSLVL